jgi:hypothetical protein
MDAAWLDSLITGFEDGTWPGAKFHHLEHLAIAVHYLTTEPDPMTVLRSKIKSYNVSQGGENTEVRGYHETITRFWLEVVRGYVTTQPLGLSKLEITKRVTEEFAAKRDIFRGYYDFDVLASKEARTAWIQPNQAPPGTTSIFPTPSV